MTRASPLKWIRTGVFGMRQDQFAEEVGASRIQVSRYERGENAPSYGYLAKVWAAGRLRRSDFSGDWFFEIPPEPANDPDSVTTADEGQVPEGARP